MLMKKSLTNGPENRLPPAPHPRTLLPSLHLRGVLMACRPIQPKIVNRWYYLAVATLAFLGGLFGAVLGNAFQNEYYVQYPANWRYWQVSPLYKPYSAFMNPVYPA